MHNWGFRTKEVGLPLTSPDFSLPIILSKHRRDKGKGQML